MNNWRRIGCFVLIGFAAQVGCAPPSPAGDSGRSATTTNVALRRLHDVTRRLHDEEIARQRAQEEKTRAAQAEADTAADERLRGDLYEDYRNSMAPSDRVYCLTREEFSGVWPYKKAYGSFQEAMQKWSNRLHQPLLEEEYTWIRMVQYHFELWRSGINFDVFYQRSRAAR